MRRSSSVLAAAALWAGSVNSASAACPDVDPALAGHYVLSGQIEVGSEIRLEPDGHYAFLLVYGAVDQFGKGCWSVEGNQLALRLGNRKVPRDASPEDRKFRGLYLMIEPDGRLRWPLPGFHGRYERQ